MASSPTPILPPTHRAIGGTSSGSLVSFLLAGLRTTPDAAVGDTLLKLLLEMPVPKFKDGALLDKALGDCLIGLTAKIHSSPWNWLLLPLFPVALVWPRLCPLLLCV